MKYAEEIKELIQSDEIIAAYHITGYGTGGNYNDFILLKAEHPNEVTAQFSLRKGFGEIAGHQVTVVEHTGKLLSYAEYEDLNIGLLKEWHRDRKCYVMYINGE